MISQTKNKKDDTNEHVQFDGKKTHMSPHCTQIPRDNWLNQKQERWSFPGKSTPTDYPVPTDLT